MINGERCDAPLRRCSTLEEEEGYDGGAARSGSTRDLYGFHRLTSTEDELMDRTLEDSSTR